MTTYNSGIEGLNRRYEEAVAAEFGQTRPSFCDYLAKGKLDEYDDALTMDSAAVSAASAAVIAQLKREEQTLHSTLDDAAAKAAGWLKTGSTQETVVALTRAGMMPLTVVDIFGGVDFTQIDFAAPQRTLATTDRSGFLDPTQFPTAAAAKRMLDLMRQDGVAPKDYGPLLQRYYLLTATEKAGIYLDGWDPSKGADANLGNLTASYAYYGKLFLGKPNFQGAGMAGMIGPTFAGGMVDLLLRTVSDLASEPLDKVSGWPMPEAYLAGGMASVKEMYDAGLIDDKTYQAWGDIDGGDAGRVAAGNEQLLYREQHDVIRQADDDMRNYYGPVGEAMTYAMGAIGAPGIPGAKTLGQVDPLEFHGRVEVLGVNTPPIDGPGPIDIPGIHTPPVWGELDVTTPLPDGNISNVDTRWDLISHDTLPAYQRLPADDPQQVRDILNGSVQDRIDNAWIANDSEDILDRLSDWDVSVRVGVG